MIMYNHAAYIEHAVRSVLMQETDFDYEIVIGEDCSTDNTRGILLDLQQQYPDKICLLFHERNQGVGKNLLKTLGACSGEYIALLEGDDFWTSPQKLQQQITLLENEPDLAMCFHPVTKYIDGEAVKLIGIPPDDRTVFTLDDLFIVGSFAHTPSIVYRAELFEYPGWIGEIVACHFPLLVLIAHYGDLGFINKVLAGYRVHPGGVWSGTDRLARAHERLKTRERLNQHFDSQYTSELKIRECLLITEFFSQAAMLYQGVVDDSPIAIDAHSTRSRCVIFVLFFAQTI
jgi:glycosyltransferase involved in cell wall biosynthesis